MDRIERGDQEPEVIRGQHDEQRRGDPVSPPLQQGADMITKEMTIGEIMRRYPQTVEVFARFGLECSDCQIADFEEIGHGAGVHKVEVEKLIADLNRAAGVQ
ncbi:DUF1858 domain-containing protein [Geobacter sp. AOG1]|uniref:DUF1858 domain-containing protein n=1 Tax=Geobacter sp. AOG1 TaxID=1566346 RepID=UPI0027E4F695|nr:DUF1858 domain-containing protein [Geobacter sp. AOG1]